MANELIISCPITGAELTKEMHPFLPTTPDEIAESVEGAVKAGASIIHLHVRDEKGKPTQRVDVFETVTKKIRERCDCILQYSTGGAVGTPVEDRCSSLRLKPEMATLSMGSLNFGNDLFENKDSTIQRIYEEIKKYNCLPELEVFDYGMMDTIDRYLKKGLLPKKYHIDFVLGVPGGMSGEIRNLIMLVDRLEKGQSWSVAGVGRYQLSLAMHAIAMGGHVRVGFEDNPYYRKGELAKTNAQLIDRVVRIAKEFDRPIANVAQTRKIMGL